MSIHTQSSIERGIVVCAQDPITFRSDVGEFEACVASIVSSRLARAIKTQPMNE